MASPRRFMPRDSSVRRLWVYLAVGLFVLIDIILVVWALSGTQPATSADGANRTEVLAAAPSEEPDRPAEDGGTEVRAETLFTAVRPTRILSALNAQTAWRATTGPCPAASATPQLTTDAGVTWKSTDATGTAQVTALQSITAQTDVIASMVALDEEDCTPQSIRTFVAGDDYGRAPDGATGVWYIDPADRSTLHSPDGSFPAPCAAVIALAPVDEDSAAVLCNDQRIHATSDSGATWPVTADLFRGIGLAVADSGYIALADGAVGCTGVQVIQLDGSLAFSTSGCLPLDPVTSTLTGAVAVAQAAGTVWLWVGETVWRSGVGGATWQ